MNATHALAIGLVGCCAAAASAEFVDAVEHFQDGKSALIQLPKWEQLLPDPWGAHSVVEPDTGFQAITADDWRCTTPGYLTAVRFAGDTVGGLERLDGFRLTVWSNRPASLDDAGCPLEPLWTYDAYLGWDVEPLRPLEAGWLVEPDGTFRVAIPKDHWFYQEGTTADPIDYWISIQGLMKADGAESSFLWSFLDRHSDLGWGGAAAFASDCFPDCPPWQNFGWPTEAPGHWWDMLHEGVQPPDWWKQADMAFELTFIPLPGSVFLLGFSSLIASRQRRPAVGLAP